MYAISKAPDVGWASGRTIGLLIASGVLLATFIVIESRHESPMVPFRIFRTKTVTGANVSGFLLGAVVYANFFLLTLYAQQVLHYSALKTGLTFLATAGTVIPVAGLSQALTTRFGPRPVMSVGLALITGGMLWYTQIPTHGAFATNLLPGYLMVGVGMAFAFVPMSIAALAGVAPQEAGLASGLINTSQQDRRRARRRDRLDGRVHAHADAARLGPQLAGRADERLLARVLGDRGRQRRLRARRGRPRAPAGADRRWGGRAGARLTYASRRWRASIRRCST